MLKNINPNLNGELLHILRSMGHGDELVIVDCNFPAVSVASETVTGQLIRMDGLDIPQLAYAILTVFPLDSFVPEPVFRMEIDGNPNKWGDCHNELKKVLNETSDREWKIGSIERHEFYKRARKAYAVVCAGGERRGYGCFILSKGVIDEDGKVI